MDKLAVQLKKDLRRSILRGHPWIYKESVNSPPSCKQAELCQVKDRQGRFLAWAYYDPFSPIALRILSLEKNPPTALTFTQRFAQALALRRKIIPPATDCFRLFNGEGDFLPGLVCDCYGPVAVMQFDGKGAETFWARYDIANWLLERTSTERVIVRSKDDAGDKFSVIAGSTLKDDVRVREHGHQFQINFEKSQKTGFFLDQRENRRYLEHLSHGLNMLNLFSYTGGFSIYAGCGGASHVTNVDIAQGALDYAKINWELNALDHKNLANVCADAGDYLTQEKGLWDIVIVDPPSMIHAEKQKKLGSQKYVSLFAAAAKRVVPRGHLMLSSCSSHVSFNDFFEIIDQSLSAAVKRAQILRVSGQAPDHPFPHACPELRYLKFAHLVVI